MRPRAREVGALIEGHPRFCRGCGHDLVGLSGQRCPRCGRTSPALVYRHKPANSTGRWAVFGILCAGMVLAAIGWQFHRIEPVVPPHDAGATTSPPLRQGVPAGAATRPTARTASSPAAVLPEIPATY